MKKFINRLQKVAVRFMNQLHAYDYPETAEGWYKYSDNPVLEDMSSSMFDPFVRKIKDTYYMLVSKRTTRTILLCESVDGICWKKRTEILFGEPNSEWETNVNRACFVVHHGYWYVWYTGQHDGKSSIGMAISKDGIHFEKYAHNPVLRPELWFECCAVMNPCVIWDEEQELFCMWYAAGENYEPDVIGYAESEDGVHWLKRQTPVMTADPSVEYQKCKVGACDVIKLPDGRFCMAYIAYQNINVARICIAYSEDGITNWKRIPENPVLSPSKGKWDQHAVYKPSLMYDVENFVTIIWYNGRSKHSEKIGVAYLEEEL